MKYKDKYINFKIQELTDKKLKELLEAGIIDRFDVTVDKVIELLPKDIKQIFRNFEDFKKWRKENFIEEINNKNFKMENEIKEVEYRNILDSLDGYKHYSATLNYVPVSFDKIRDYIKQYYTEKDGITVVLKNENYWKYL